VSDGQSSKGSAFNNAWQLNRSDTYELKRAEPELLGGEELSRAGREGGGRRRRRRRGRRRMAGQLKAC